MASSSTLSMFVLLATVLGTAHAHDWGFGRCPRVPSFPNLAVEKFLGPWYVIEQFDTGSRCLMLNYTRVSETQLRVTKLRQFHLLDRVGVEHTNSYSGSLDIPHEHDQARLRVKWPLNLAGKGDYIILDTDYSTYAGIYECQELTTIMHRKSAAILSRTPTLSNEFVGRIKRILRSAGVPTHDFDKIKHEGCRTRAEADINVHVDSDTFKHVVEGTRTGLEDAATTLVKGIRDLATTVSQASQDTFSTIQDTAQTAFSSPVPQSPTVETNIRPGIENIDAGLRGSAQDNFDKAEEAVEEAIERADETIKDTKDFINERVETEATNINNFGGGIVASILERRNKEPETTNEKNVHQTTRQNNDPQTTRQNNVPQTTRQNNAPQTTRQNNVPQTTRQTSVQTSATSATTPEKVVTSTPKSTTKMVETYANIDESINNIDESLNSIDGSSNNRNRNGNNLEEEENKKKLDENYYSISNIAEEVVPVDDIVRTVVSIDKKKK